MDDLVKKYQETSENLVDITQQGHLTASSSQPTHPVSCLTDGSPYTYWQSNGGQPHSLTLKFGKLAEIWEIWFFMNYEEDESYTPSRIQICMGTGEHDLHPCLELTLEEPVGWVKSESLEGIKCYMLNLRIEENHLSGKDTLIRGFKVYTKRPRGTDMKYIMSAR